MNCNPSFIILLVLCYHLCLCLTKTSYTNVAQLYQLDKERYLVTQSVEQRRRAVCFGELEVEGNFGSVSSVAVNYDSESRRLVVGDTLFNTCSRRPSMQSLVVKYEGDGDGNFVLALPQSTSAMYLLDEPVVRLYRCSFRECEPEPTELVMKGENGILVNSRRAIASLKIANETSDTAAIVFIASTLVQISKRPKNGLVVYHQIEFGLYVHTYNITSSETIAEYKLSSLKVNEKDNLFTVNRHLNKENEDFPTALTWTELPVPSLRSAYDLRSGVNFVLSKVAYWSESSRSLVGEQLTLHSIDNLGSDTAKVVIDDKGINGDVAVDTEGNIIIAYLRNSQKQNLEVMLTLCKMTNSQITCSKPETLASYVSASPIYKVDSPRIAISENNFSVVWLENTFIGMSMCSTISNCSSHTRITNSTLSNDYELLNAFYASPDTILVAVSHPLYGLRIINSDGTHGLSFISPQPDACPSDCKQKRKHPINMWFLALVVPTIFLIILLIAGFISCIVRYLPLRISKRLLGSYHPERWRARTDEVQRLNQQYPAEE